MLVAISDLHFVDGTAGEHNLPYSAFSSVFLSDIAAAARAKKAREIRILLLGDVVDLIRSTVWLEADPEDRPWGANGRKTFRIPGKTAPPGKYAWIFWAGLLRGN
jgi:hypothetical protein